MYIKLKNYLEGGIKFRGVKKFTQPAGKGQKYKQKREKQSTWTQQDLKSIL